MTAEDSGGGMRLTLHQTVEEARARQTGAYPSWIDMLNRLAERLECECRARRGSAG